MYPTPKRDIILGIETQHRRHFRGLGKVTAHSLEDWNVISIMKTVKRIRMVLQTYLELCWNDTNGGIISRVKLEINALPATNLFDVAQGWKFLKI